MWPGAEVASVFQSALFVVFVLLVLLSLFRFVEEGPIFLGVPLRVSCVFVLVDSC